MDITIYPTKLNGTLRAIPSKSHAHRILICSAFADAPTDITCPESNQDIEATVDCLNAIGAVIHRTDMGYHVIPVSKVLTKATLNCQESGSTLRFLLPIVGALGIDATIQMSGRLPERPLSPLWEEMERMGCVLSRPSKNTLRCCGQLQTGEYTISGNISSQYISGLLFATALLSGDSKLIITGKLESKPYVEMTQQVLFSFGVMTTGFKVSGCRPFHTPRNICIEGDWSNAAFFLAANALGNQVNIDGLQEDSAQGDRSILQFLKMFEKPCTVAAADTPDLVPILAVVAGAKHGVTFTDIARLRLKESDRVATTTALLTNLGATVTATENTFTVKPGKYHSCTIDAAGDHRIAMAAAIAATVANGPVTILGAQCVSKSYPSFWDEYRRLGGNYEQLLG